MHETRRKLLETTLDLMALHGAEGVTAEMVLRLSGVSKGSLYHHFEDFPDLLETALTELFTQSVDYNSAIMRQIVVESHSPEDCFLRLSQVTRRTQSSQNYLIRAQRAGVLAICASNARLARKIGKAQTRLTQTYANLFAALQQRGWMNSNFDPHSAAILIQAYTVGKIVDDIATDRVDPEQ